MEKSEKQEALAAALCKAQGSFPPVKKNKKMEIRGRDPYWYASLDEVIKTLQPALTENGLIITQEPDMVDGKPVLVTTLLHISGQYRTSWQPIHDSPKHQDYGIEVSYKRRYAYNSVLGIHPEDDVDGIQEEKGPSQPPAVQAPKMASGPQIQMIKTRLVRLGYSENEIGEFVGKRTSKKGWNQVTTQDIDQLVAEIIRIEAAAPPVAPQVTPQDQSWQDEIKGF